ncbi:FAD/NAD(P)-binding protein [Pseudooceanicola onchidii]|uniref:FAD/NAD(P)-binding protein n=1 Tax=Pseudooceanicola onchidii TaxID=2562279 RepID=UPI00145BBC6E|nr:FAD/NAD(P)-binding protein [Pseudooceanicola onchidii]
MERLAFQKIAIIGLGPRGLGALEALADCATARGVRLEVDIFDTYPEPGAGPNFDPREPQHCLVNIPLRDIDLRRPEGLDLTPFAQWLGPRFGKDDFPPRAEVGQYLEQRFDKLKDTATMMTTRHYPEQVECLQRKDDAWHVHTGPNAHGPYAEVLMVPGQPPTRPDDQLADWKAHAADRDTTLAAAYPARALEKAAEQWSGQTLAIRGFALSSFDVIRVLTVGQGGRFAGGQYLASGQEPACIVPFSIDGKPPYPKPATGEIDARYEPTPDETEVFRKAVFEASKGTPEAAQAHLTDALATPVFRILSTFGTEGIRSAVGDWLAREWSDPGCQEDASALEVLKDGVAMAEGVSAPSIGYVVGQVWRKWQDPLRQAYNPANTPPATAAAIVGFDEGLKRYSYGPPVSACRELMTLIDAGIVSIEWARDPDISLMNTGWQLNVRDQSVTATVMIDAVLPSPDPQQVVSPLISGLMTDGYLTTLDDLGARTASDGRLIGDDNEPVQGLSLLGRLALGSVIAADSLHDCFGASSKRWAEGVLSRLS